MKKFLSILLALMMVCSAAMIASCGSDNDKTSDTGTAQSTEQGTVTTTPADPASGNQQGGTTQNGEQKTTTTPNDGQQTTPSKGDEQNTTTPAQQSTETPINPAEDFNGAVAEGVDGLIDSAFKLKDVTMPKYDSFGAEAELKVTLDSSLKDILSAILPEGSSAEVVDLSFIRELAVQGAIDKNQDLIKLACRVLLNGKDVVGADVLADLAAMKAVAKVPLLGNGYIELPMEQIIQALASVLAGRTGFATPDYYDYDYDFGDYDYEDYEDYGDYDEYEDYEEYGDDIAVNPYGVDPEQLIALLNQLAEKLPDEQTTKAIVNRYLTVVMNSFTDQKVGTTVYTIGDVSKELTTVTVTVTPQMIVNAVLNVLRTVKDDADVKQIVEDFASVLGAEGAYEQFVAAVDNALSQINAATEKQINDGPTIVVVLYYDGTDFAGIDVAASYREKEIKFTAVAIEAGTKQALVFNVTAEESSIGVQYIGSKIDNKVTGAVVITANEMKLFTISITDLDVAALKEGKFVGKISICINEILQSAYDLTQESSFAQIKNYIDAVDTQMTLYIEGSDAENILSRKVALATSVKDLIAVQLTLALRDAKDIGELPEGTPLEEVAGAIDPETVLANLTAALTSAGVPQEAIELLKEMIGGGTAVPVYLDERLLGSWTDADKTVTFTFNEDGKASLKYTDGPLVYCYYDCSGGEILFDNGDLGQFSYPYYFDGDTLYLGTDFGEYAPLTKV